MKLLPIHSCLFLLLVLFSGCKTTSENESGAKGSGMSTPPRYTIQAKSTCTFSDDDGVIPKSVYVFPPLQVDGKGRPIEQLRPRKTTSGELEWSTGTALGSELKYKAEQAAGKRGFRTISFDQLSEARSDHGILVLNAYYAGQLDAEHPDDPPVAFIRLVGSTFGPDLSPAGKREIFNQEVVAVYHPEAQATDVVARALRYSIESIGRKGEWVKLLSLLN